MNLIQRVQSPTPTFFKKIRNISLVLAAVSGTLLTAPVALPVVILKAAGYLGLAGMVAGVVSQTAVCDEPSTEVQKLKDGS